MMNISNKFLMVWQTCCPRKCWISRRGALELAEWQKAFNQSGRESSFARASIIGKEIYDRAAPVPDVTPSPDRNLFLHEVEGLVEAACVEVGATLA